MNSTAYTPRYGFLTEKDTRTQSTDSGAQSSTHRGAFLLVYRYILEYAVYNYLLYIPEEVMHEPERYHSTVKPSKVTTVR